MQKLNPNVFTEEGKKIISETTEQLVKNTQKEQDTKKPTGACKISVWTQKSCFDGLTFDSCMKVATNLGGVADWQEGGKCPK